MTNSIKEQRETMLAKIKSMEREDILRVLNGTYIANRFFGKSSCWFSQKLNGNIKNGKPCEFSPDELRQLRDAIRIIAIELQGLADELQ